MPGILDGRDGISTTDSRCTISLDSLSGASKTPAIHYLDASECFPGPERGTPYRPGCISLDWKLTKTQGWITWFSWISLLAGVANIAALMIQALVVASYPNYVSKGWHVTLIIYALLIVQGLMNQYAFWTIPWIEMLSGLLHVIMWLVFVSVLVTLAPRHSSHFVFLEKSSALSGWDNDYVSWNLGMLTATWGFVGKFFGAYVLPTRF